MGMGYWGWLLAIFTIPPIIADKFNIPLVFMLKMEKWNI